MNVEESEFDWNKYLEETGSQAAPADFFFQARDPPKNAFEDGMLLEAYDSRFPNIRCMAEVTAVYGPKIRIRMIGTCDNDDIWVLVDNPQIRPVGTAESQGVLIQPPFNCRFEITKCSKMVKNALQNLTHAPKECFIKEPDRPNANLFQVGMKLEASDTKNAVFVCPATVKEVKADKIRIEFDGWNMSDWFRYDSREIYPVGWWERSGAKIQPPHKKKRKQGPPAKKLNSNTGQQSTADKEVTLINLFDSAKSILTEQSRKHETLQTGSGTQNGVAPSAPDNLNQKIPPSITPPLSRGFKDIEYKSAPPFSVVKPKARKTIGAVGTASPLSVDVDAAAAAVNGLASPWRSASDGTASKDIGIGQRTSIDAVVESVLCIAKQASPGSASPSGHVAKKRLISIPVENVTDPTEFVVYLNPYCLAGRWIDAAKLRSVQCNRFGPGNVNHVMRCCLQTLIDCAAPSDVGYVMNCVTSGDGDTTLSADVDGSMMVRRLPRWRSVLDAWKFLSEVLDKLQSCPHLLSKRFDSCQSCSGATVSVAAAAESSVNNGSVTASAATPYLKKTKLSPTVDALSLDSVGRSRHLSGGSSSSTCTERDLASLGPHLGEDISKWAVDDVARFVYSVSDSVTSDLFRKQEIDGKAMLLLTADMMIRYMNVRLGPALKIGNAIDKFKANVK